MTAEDLIRHYIERLIRTENIEALVSLFAASKAAQTTELKNFARAEAARLQAQLDGLDAQTARAKTTLADEVADWREAAL